jgi:F0F1-type ATP synthase epsilon subunit
MNLLIISPEGKKTYTVAWVKAETPQGALTIHPEHAPLIVTLRENSELVFQLTTEEEHSLLVHRSGFLEVDRKHVIVLLNQAIE